MKPLSSPRSRHTKRPAASRMSRCRPLLERLDDRTVLSATFTVSDASAIEGGAALKVLDRFVSVGSGGLATPRSSSFGPDGNGDGSEDLYVVSGGSDAILRYDGATGAFMDAFVPSGSGGLDDPNDLAFGPDGNLYVSSYSLGQVLKYDANGTFLGVVVSGLSPGPTGSIGITFGADGHLYITNSDTDEVLRYDGSDLSVFVSAGSGGLNRPRHAVFGPDGNLYVASADTNQVLRYHGLTGAFIDTFATTTLGGTGPSWLEFGTDGYLYVTARTTSVGFDTSIVRFDAMTGVFVDRRDLGRDGWSFSLGPDNVVYSSSNGLGNFIERLAPSSVAVFTVTLSAASAVPVTVSYATGDGIATAGSDYTAVSGTLTFAPGQTTRTVLVQTLDDSVGEPNETYFLSLSNPVGATISDGQGVATISEAEATKYYVVNDGSPDQTYRYGTQGTAQTSTSLSSDNTAPRGAASNLAGDRVWVVDANKKVYVYDGAGGLLGSWAAGSLVANAQVEDVATNGTDIWIVDAKQDKVYRYTGAASRTNGSQNAASSYNLASGNKDPKGIVTDGTYLWVVNDAANDKVFKYTLSGTLLGSWTLNGGGGAPTGITLDPSSPAHLWVVDSATDRVYQYDNAVGRTSGSQSASGSFALAAGNANPQGIADPPPPGMALPPSATSRAWKQPSIAAFTVAASSGAAVVAASPSLADRDALFATLAREPFRAPDGVWIHLASGASLTPPLGIPTLVAGVAPSGQAPMEQLATPTRGNSQRTRPESAPASWLSATLAEQANQEAETLPGSFSTETAEGVPAEE